MESEELDKKQEQSTSKTSLKTISGMYENWYLDYASYVILERAIPHIRDGLKPVQRRILHSMYELEDGRYNKVANIIGNTMKYHPHGDASIGDALVQLGQKELLIDTQGNWGNILTGDTAAAPRYIEARLSKLALETAFNPKITPWKISYDGRNKEPIYLPIKFPLLIIQGIEGIAVSLQVRILPHNFNEVLDACIAYLKGESFTLYPDFPSGGLIDVTNYNDGQKKGQIISRAKLEILDNKSIVIREIPYGVTTGQLIDSIVDATNRGHLKIKKIEDNTASEVEITLILSPDVTPDQTIDALYAFTKCEVKISTNCVVIDDNTPVFLSISELLKETTDNIVGFIKESLEVERQEFLEKLLFASLEKIFIENHIYQDIENCETWEDVINTIDKGLEPFKNQFYRPITRDDIIKLTEIKIKRISKYDAFKADEIMIKLQKQLDAVNANLDNLIQYSIEHFKYLKNTYGKNFTRRTEIRTFGSIEKDKVAAPNQKIYVNRAEGFVGTSLKKDEYLFDCSALSNLIVFKDDGTFKVIKVDDKVFVGENIIHVAIYDPNDTRTTYNVLYRDGNSGGVYAKRFFVKSIIRDKDYFYTRGTPNSKVLYFKANQNGEAEILTIHLVPRPRMKNLTIDFNFKDIPIKNRSTVGYLVTRKLIRHISIKQEGIQTLKGISYYFDEETLRINKEGKGIDLGEFLDDDYLIIIYKNGYYRISKPNESLFIDSNYLIVEKFSLQSLFTVIYRNNDQKSQHIKRFIPDFTLDKNIYFLPEENSCEILFFTKEWLCDIQINYSNKSKEIIKLDQQFPINSLKAKGKKISNNKIKNVEILNIQGPTEDWLKNIFPDDDENNETADNDNDDLDIELDTGQIILPL